MNTPRISKLSQLDAIEAPDLWDEILDRVPTIEGSALSLEGLDEEAEAIEFVPFSENETGGPHMTPAKWLTAALAAAAIALIIGYLTARNDPPTDVATTPNETTTTTEVTTTQQTEPTDVPADAGVAALEIAQAYFAGLASGDIESMRATFSENATIVGVFGVERFMLERVRAKAAGDQFGPRVCEIDSAAPPVDGTTNVVCEGITEPYILQSLGLTGVNVIAEMSIGPDGIERLDFRGTDDEHQRAQLSWQNWMRVNEAEAQATLTLEVTSAEQAEEQGELAAQMIDAWVTYLAENGCVYDEPCLTAG